MLSETRSPEENAGLLQRDAGGFILQCDNGENYRLELLRTPIDEVEKRVVVTGKIRGNGLLEADGVRLA